MIAPNAIVVVPTVTKTGPNVGLMTTGGIMAGVGVASLFTGLVLAALSHGTIVTQAPAVDAHTPTPTWREAGPADATKPRLVSLLSRSF